MEDDNMEIGNAYTRKNFEYLVVGKVPHMAKEGVFVYTIAEREFGAEEINYYTQEHEFGGNGYKETVWVYC
jgi:hypothetical protein